MTDADVGATLRVKVTATNSSGSRVATSAPSLLVLGQVASLGLQYRPSLLFHLGDPAPNWSAENWRPLEITRFLTEWGDNPDDVLTRVCHHATGQCQAISHENPQSALTSNNDTDAYIDIYGAFTPSGQPDWTCYHNVSTGATVFDCDDGPQSALYYTVGQDSAAYRYFDYWIFYRDNRPGGTFGQLDDHEGDWEGVTVVLDGIASPPGTPAFAYYAAHNGGAWYSANALPLDGLHVKDYVARGTHASYPYVCTESESCHTPSNVDWPWESAHDGGAGWGNNDDVYCAQVCAQRMTATWWVNWLGRWGETTDGTISIGNSPVSPGLQSRFACAMSGYGAGCERPPDARTPTRRGAPIAESPRTCAGWFGSGVSVLACDPLLLRNALRTHRMKSRGALHLSVQGHRSGDSPGLAQVIGEPLRIGDTVTVFGRGTARTKLFIGVSVKKHLYRLTVKFPDLPNTRRFVLRIVRVYGRPSVAVGGRRVPTATAVLR